MLYIALSFICNISENIFWRNFEYKFVSEVKFLFSFSYIHCLLLFNGKLLKWNSTIWNLSWFLCWRKPDVWSRGTSHHAPQLAPKTTNNTKFRDVWKYRLEVQPGSPVQLLYIFFFVLLFHTNFLHFVNHIQACLMGLNRFLVVKKPFRIIMLMLKPADQPLPL